MEAPLQLTYSSVHKLILKANIRVCKTKGIKYLIFTILIWFLSTIQIVPAQTPSVTPSSPIQFSAEAPHNTNTDSQTTTPTTTCPNSNFSQGTFSNWSGYYGTFSNPSANIGFMSVPPNERHLIFSAPGSIDPYGTTAAGTATLTTVFPGEAYSARLGNSATGAQAEMLTYNITVGPENDIFLYRFAVVLNDNGHPPVQQPSFEVEIINQASGQQFDPICGYYKAYAQPGLPGWNTSPNQANGAPVYWQNWTTHGLAFDTSDYGETYTVKFTTKDCSPSGHFGYAYVSASCGSLSVSYQECGSSGFAIMTAPPGFTQYEWSGPYCPSCPMPAPIVGTGQTCSVTTSQGAVTGNSFKCILTSGSGCITTKSVTIPVNPATTVNPIANQFYCNGDLVPITYVTSPVVGTTFTWTNNNPAIGLATVGTGNVSGFTAINPSIAPINATITITPTVNGCVGPPLSYIVVVNPTPEVNPIADQTYCRGDLAPLTPLAGPVGGTNFNWTNNNTSIGLAPSGIGNVPSFTTTNFTNTPITAVITIIPISNGCIGTALSYNITVSPSQIPSIMGDSTSCSGQTGVVYTTDPGMSYYYWSILPSGAGYFTSGGGGNDHSATITWINPGINSVTVNYHTYGCFASMGSTKTVTVYALPEPTISGSPYVCNGSTGKIYFTDPGNSDYDWTISSGGIITAGQGTNSITVSFTTPGAQEIEVNYTDFHGCTAESPGYIIVLVNPIPNVNPVSNQVVCNGTLTAPILFTGDVTGTVYHWINSNPAIGLAATGTGNIAAFTAKNTSSNSIIANISVTPYKTFGITCSGSTTTFTITVNQGPLAIINGPSASCANSSGSNYVTEPGKLNYSWAIKPPGSGIIIVGAGTNSITVTWINQGNNTVQVNYSDSLGCTSAIPGSFTVTVNPVTPVIIGNDSVCLNSTGNVFTTQPGMTKYTWTVSLGGTITSGGSKNDNFIEVNWTAPGAKSVSVNYTDPNGCMASSPTVFPVTVLPLPSPSISTPPLLAESFENSGNPPTGWAIEQVDPGNNLSFVTASSYPSGYPAYNGSYCVRFDSYDNDNGIIRLKRTSSISTLGLTQVTLDFAWLESNAIAVANDRVEVEWSSDGANWSTFNTYSRYNAVQGWKFKNVSLPVAALNQPSMFIAFKFISEYGMDCYLDFVHLTTAAAVSTGSSIVYSTQSGMTNYDWTVSSGGTIISGAGTSSIVVNWNTLGNQAVSVNYVNSNGCIAISPTILPIPVVPQIPAQNNLSNVTVGGGQVKCYNATQTITVAGNGTPFLVQPGGMATMIAGQNIIYLPTTTVQSGGYMWGYIAPSGPWCQTPSMPAVAMLKDEIPRIIQQSSFKIYPNPTTGNFILELIGDANKVSVDIYGIWGEKILSKALNGERKHEFSLSDKPVGVYFIRVVSGDKAEIVKIIKQ